VEFSRDRDLGADEHSRGGVGTQLRANSGVLALAAPRKIARRTIRNGAAPSIGNQMARRMFWKVASSSSSAQNSEQYSLARRRAPCIEIVRFLLEGLPTVGTTAGRALDREAADDTHHTPPPGA
jgi:hypothetical protein